ncbi:MAG: 4-hydroxybenzoate octaprenyltransferase [Schwartzia sp.]|nr:4-hydroxybenzoate octaprenyltransferase [Schwartzia sp. (in: firmicutes)]
MRFSLRKARAHIENIALHHTIFDLPFAYMGAFLAAGGMPPFATLAWITLAITGARSAALALDNLVDLKYDRQHPRFTRRPMVTGAVKKWEAALLIVVSLLVCVAAVAMLPPVCLRLLPLAALPFLIYPFMKRVTFACHGVLGLAIAMAPAGGWVAVRGAIDAPMIMLCLAVGIWIGAFDVVYGAQDVTFDRAHGLHSMAVTVGAANALKIARFFHAVCIACFCLLGLMLHVALPYYVGVAIAAATLIYQHGIIAPYDFTALTQWYFMRNGIVSVAMLACTVIALL